MSRKYDILILGIESDIGQRIWTVLNQDYKYLKVAVPMEEYSANILLPTNQINMKFVKPEDKKMSALVKLFKVIINCSKKRKYFSVCDFAVKEKIQLVDVSNFSPEIVIDLVLQTIECAENQKGKLYIQCNFYNFWRYLFLPKDNFIPQAEKSFTHVKIGETRNVEFFLTFQYLLISYLYFILGTFAGFFRYININSSLSFTKKDRWTFEMEKTPSKNKVEMKTYFLSPTQTENEIIIEYIKFHLMKSFNLRNPSLDKYKFTSFKVDL